MNTTDEVRAAERCQDMLDGPGWHDWENVSVECVKDLAILARAYLATRADPGGERERKLREVFEVGYELRAFLFSSHCYDARDIGRFFAIDGLPKWVRELGKQYDAQVNWTREKDHGVFIVMKVFRDFFSTPAAPPPTPASREVCPECLGGGQVCCCGKPLNGSHDHYTCGPPIPCDRCEQPIPAADLLDGVDYREGHNRDNRTPDELREIVRQMADRLAALQRFKDWVHAYLDKAGIPTHPDGPHSKEGCRIGDRMDLFGRHPAEVVEMAKDVLYTPVRELANVTDDSLPRKIATIAHYIVKDKQ